MVSFAHWLHAECMFSIAYLTINVQLHLGSAQYLTVKVDQNSKYPPSFTSIPRSI